MSILVTTTMTGTLSAKAIPRCSLVRSDDGATLASDGSNAYLLMPISPLLAATINRQ